MPTAVIMPKFEMTQETGKVVAWLKNEGDQVEKGEALLEVETDKVNQEVEAPATGILAGISARPGEVVPIATPIAYIMKPGETLETASPAGKPAVTPTATPAVPQADTHVDAHAGALAKATPLAARLAESHGLDLNTITGTGPLGRISREDVEAALARTAQGGVAEDAAAWDGKVRAVPAARRIARELGVDLREVRGTGPDGRIQSDDVVAAAERPVPGPQSPVPTIPSPPPAFDAIAVRRVVPLTNIRRTIAERMTASVREAPQFTVSVDVDMGRALDVVEDLKARTAEGQARVTLTAIIVKACAWALRQHPEANASFRDDGIVEWDEVNVGVATAIEAGLIVPVVREADASGLRRIAEQMADLTSRARAGKLRLEDLQGGTFTVSNLGMLGIDRFTAIVNPPQAAILAVGRVARRAEVFDDKIEIRPMASLALTADHRVLDGAAAARFLATIRSALEHPGLLLE